MDQIGSYPTRHTRPQRRSQTASGKRGKGETQWPVEATDPRRHHLQALTQRCTATSIRK